MNLKLQIHETISGVVTSHAEVQLHFFLGMNVALSQHFIAKIVDFWAVKAVTIGLL